VWQRDEQTYCSSSSCVSYSRFQSVGIFVIPFSFPSTLSPAFHFLFPFRWPLTLYNSTNPLRPGSNVSVSHVHCTSGKKNFHWLLWQWIMKLLVLVYRLVRELPLSEWRHCLASLLRVCKQKYNPEVLNLNAKYYKNKLQRHLFSIGFLTPALLFPHPTRVVQKYQLTVKISIIIRLTCFIG